MDSKKLSSFNCPMCHKKFSRKSNVRRHLQDVHSRKWKWKCYCGIQFKRKDSLQKHLSKPTCIGILTVLLDGSGGRGYLLSR